MRLGPIDIQVMLACKWCLSEPLTYSVASIARAAASGLAACVMGRPITRMEAPASSACRGVITRF